MAFSHFRGPLRIVYRPKIASTVFSAGDLMYADGSGAVQEADATSGDHVGVSLRESASTDSDYASNTRIPLIQATDSTEFKVDVTTGTLTTAMVDLYRDLTDGAGIDVNATAKNIVLISQFSSASVAIVYVSAHVTSRRVATT